MDDCFGAAAARLCHAACLMLAWRPDEFWQATPAELTLAVQEPALTAEGPDRALIDELRRRFPDETKA